MKKKIMKVMLIISSFLLILFGVITVYTLGRLRSILIENSEISGDRVEKYSDSAMRDQLMERLKTTTQGCAYIVNETLENFAGTIQMIAYSATDIYSNPGSYGQASVRIPDESDIGKSMGQFVYAEDVDPSDESIRQELSMIGNLQGSLVAMYGQYPDLGASYIGTESGILLLAGPVLAERWDENGNYVNLDPRTRPWYIGARDSQGLYFSDITEDYDTGRLAIMCSAPVYKGDEMVAVAGAGVYVEGLNTLVMGARISDEGYSCLIDSKGKILFSSNDEGDLATHTILGKDTDNDELKAMVRSATDGNSGTAHLDINGESCYVAYYPLDVVGWSMISVIPEKIVLAPKEDLLTALKDSRDSDFKKVQNVIGSALFTIFVLIVLIGLLAFFAANMFSKRLVAPITELTDKVQKLEGNSLEFEWNRDTGDEVQKLANAFGLMTGRIKSYISYTKKVTAEKERISAELSLATKIQASILPNKFPPFPDRNEFDIFAMMEPAREVGGDFYDFFFIDDDHLGLVMADVSGKGIPAALFMMIDKVIVQSCAMLGQSASEILNKTNEALTSNNQTGMFVTVWVGILEISTGIMNCANAGHEYPAIMRSGGKFELIRDKHGFVIGGMEGVKYKEYTLELGHGDKLFLYTDGVPEATDKDNNMYGTDRMIAALNKNPEGSPKQILKTVRGDVSAFVKDAEQFDDLTMMCLIYN
jgi:sigma-B regulation protein RsbU (phosphoserine phosphatase)